MSPDLMTAAIAVGMVWALLANSVMLLARSDAFLPPSLPVVISLYVGSVFGVMTMPLVILDYLRLALENPDDYTGMMFMFSMLNFLFLGIASYNLAAYKMAHDH